MKDQQQKSGEGYRAAKENNDFPYFEIMDRVLCDKQSCNSQYIYDQVISRKNPATLLNSMPAFLTKRNIQILMSA